MTATSFKQLIKDGTIKRADAMRVPFAAIQVEAGFNLRIEGPDLEASIDALADFIFDGGQVPPLEVRPTDGGVIVVDGHRRLRAFAKAIERGAPIDYIDVVAFRGNDVDRVARIMTSAESLPLNPLETARGYKRLTGFGLSPDDIARKVGKTRQHVEQLLILANANSDVQAMVQSGVVSSSLAVEAVREHGDVAGSFLAQKYVEAKAAGKQKVTASTVRGKNLPRAVVTGAVSALSEFSQALDIKARTQIAAAEMGGDGDVVVSAQALAKLMRAQFDIEEAQRKQDERDREKQARAAQMDCVDA